MYCSHSIVFRSTTTEASINRISFNRYRLSFNLHHSLFFHISINHRYLIVGVLSGVADEGLLAEGLFWIPSFARPTTRS
ncbi:hypothetical protein Hanom_Chr13g01214321 [Helianthus anomalus]